MNMLETPFYGDRTRWFFAKVINNVDPDMLGRVQIRIEGIHSRDNIDIPEHALPWATVLVPSTNGGTSGIGKNPKLLPEAFVYGIFLDGVTSQLPLVLGHINHLEIPSEVQQEQASKNPELPDASPSPSGASSGASSVGTYGTSSYGNYGKDGMVIPTEVLNIDTGNVNKDERRLAAMKFYVANGLTPVQAAAIVGNLEAESAFSTTVVSGIPGENSQGLAQWNPAKAAGNRLGKLKQYASNTNSDWRSFDTQLRYTLHELKGTPSKNDGGGSHSNVFSKLQKTTSFDGGVKSTNATWIINRYYENPKNPEGKNPQREKFARKAYEQYNNAARSGNVQ